MNGKNAALKEKQIALTRYLRNPEVVAPPDRMELRRLKVYQELIFNNIEDFLSSGFPVLRSIVCKADWLTLVRRFVVDYRAHSPYFLEIGQEFLSFVQGSDAAQAQLPSFALELMHYEWVELALDVSPSTHPEPCDQPPVTIASKVRLSGLAWPLAYQYPVQNLGPGYQPTEIPPSPTFLLVYRDRAHRVKFMALNGMSYALLTSIDDNAEADLSVLIKNLFDLVHGNQSGQGADIFIEQALVMVQRFVDQDILHIC